MLYNRCNKGCGIRYPICGMVHIKELLQLIRKSSPCMVAAGFLSCYLNGPLPYNHNKNVLSASLNETLLSFLSVYYFLRWTSNKTYSLTAYDTVILKSPWRKEGNVLFNDGLITFLFMVIWFQAYAHMGKDNDRGNLLPPLHGLLLLMNRKGFFYMHHHTERTLHATIVVEHWQEWEIVLIFVF